MKVILIEDVKSLGKKGTLCEASDGYARNYLFPRKLAIPATEGNQQDLAHKKKKEDERKQKEKDQAVLLGKKLEALNLIMKVKTGEKGRLFGSVTNKEIAEQLQEIHGLKIDKRKIEMKESIKMIGSYEALVKLHPEVSACLKITLESF